jgi:hypothetical protein
MFSFTANASARALLAAAVFAPALLTTENAAAADRSDEFGRFKRNAPVESPQDMAVEIRFGRYIPGADEGLEGTPYRDVFGKGNRYFGGLELDWQALRIPHVGTFGPGAGIGYTKASAKALLEDGTASAQTTSLEILPMYVVGVLRADALARETPIPLVPYAKLGLGYALWRSSDAGEASRVDGVVGRSHSFGYQFALGGMLLLDWFDRQDARTADSNIGLNHSYVFVEWYVSKLDGFGGKQLQVGTNTWMAGLAFEF